MDGSTINGSQLHAIRISKMSATTKQCVDEYEVT